MKVTDFSTVKRGITATIFILFSLVGYSQKTVFLEVPVKLEIDKGELDGVVVKVKKEGKDAFTQSGASKMRFKLDFNKKYSLIFTKPGYITKTIEINSNAPETRIEEGFDAYKIGVKLYKQGDKENAVAYNQPVARIKYDETLDEFTFDTDYSKSILSSFSLEKEPAEIEAQTPTPTPAIASIASSIDPGTIKTIDSTNEPEVSKAPEPKKEPISTTNSESPKTTIDSPISDQPISESLPTMTAEPIKKMSPIVRKEEKQHIKPLVGEQALAKKVPASGTDINMRPLNTSAGNEKPTYTQHASSGIDDNNTPSSYNEDEKITREDIVEKNRIVTRVKVIKGTLTTEYSCIYYKWGGQYYFKNNSTSINENLFVQWTGIRP